MKIWVLGSGSRGNAVLVQSGESRVIIDCGFGPRILKLRLQSIGIEPESIDAAAYLANFAAEFAAVEKASATALDIQVRTAQRIRFDRQHLDQVLWNIARNLSSRP